MIRIEEEEQVRQDRGERRKTGREGGKVRQEGEGKTGKR